jgi:ADP-ribosylglycohydrolase
MLGAIAGDIIGSIFEFHNADRIDFPLLGSGCHFTDDSVLTIAVADALLSDCPYVEKIKAYYHFYPHAGYGGNFRRWAASASLQPYNSFGNGSAMRVSPVAYAFDDLDTVISEATRSADCTHNHPEGIKGAQAVAAAIFWARKGRTKEDIRGEIENRFGYCFSDTVQNLHGSYRFDETCQGSVPQAITAFLESHDFESAIRNAIYIGGDSDTLACMAGAIAEAYYGGVPLPVREFVFQRLDERLSGVVRTFLAKYPDQRSRPGL